MARVTCQSVNVEAARRLDDDAVLLGESPGPGSGGQVLEWLRLADPGEGVAEDGFDQVQSAQGHLAIRLDPSSEGLRSIR